MKKLWMVIFAGCLLLFVTGLHANENTPKKAPVASKEPIQVVSDRLEAFDDQKLVVFSGNAVAVQGDKVIKSDSIYLYYKKDKAASRGKSAKEMGGAGDLERIEAKGHVVITQGPKVVTGELAIYYQDEQKITMTGNPVMREGSNTITGDKIVVFLNESRGVVERSDNKRVTAIIYPSEKQEGKQKKDKKK